MRVLWLNWRDLKNPEAGGAEVFTHEVMKRLQKIGHSLTLFTSNYSGGRSKENLDDIEIIRAGGKYSVYREAKRYCTRTSSDYDLVVDEINTKPFMTPTFVKKPILAVFHQMAREFWFYETRFPLNYIGYYFLEKRWLSIYRDVMTATVSDSSKHDLEELGFGKVTLVSEGMDVTPLQEVAEKEPAPTVLFVGRLKKAKLPDHAIQAFSTIKHEIPDAKMWVIGDGYMRQDLEGTAIKDVTFFGRIDNERKYNLMKRAHVLMMPAVREGWGLVVTEANAMGTPAVGYNVPGVRDSIRDGETGLLAKENSPAGLAQSVLSILNDREALNKMSNDALKFSSKFSWDTTADQFDILLKNLVNGNAR